MKKYLLFLAWVCTGFFSQVFAQKTVNVSNINELIQAIAPNKIIKLKANKFILSNLNINISNPHVNLEPVEDGFRVEIKGVSNLRIEGASERKSKIISNSRYAPILVFNDCDNISIDNIEAGHGSSKGICKGEVLAFHNSKKITLTNTILFGSGTEGLLLNNCTESRFDNVTIRGCTQGILTIRNSSQIDFINCRFTDNRQFDLINIFDSEKITLSNCLIDLNRSGDGSPHNIYALFNAPLTLGMHDPILTLTKCTIEDNYCQYFCRSGNAVKLVDCQLDNNIFEKGYNSHK